MKLKGGAYEMSAECLAIFRNPQNYGLNPDDYNNLNFEEFAKNKVGGGYIKKVTKKKETKKKETKKKETKKKETKKKETKKRVSKKKETKKKVTKKGGGVLGNYVKSLQ